MLGTVTHIKAKTAIGVNRNSAESSKKLRVAAYCRVSTDSEEQISSYESQVKYYKEKIEERDDWKLVKIFADEAISGTKIDKREDFQRMINSALAGEIDLIMTKSISRFARNTLDTLKYVRMLKEQNVAIYFEEENINTLTMDGELLLTILSSVAQQEVHNTSEHVKKGLKMKMQRGELVGFQGCLGYDYDTKTKALTINKEEAKTVKYIFRRYLEGAGATVIARELKELGYKTKNGNLEWRSSGILGIIGNEKYAGDILLGKTFTVDPISKRRLANLGESDQFYLENHHEPIVSKEDCEKKYASISKEIEMVKGELDRYQDRKREQSEVKGKLKAFKETILKHKKIDEFQREILETTVDKIIVGGFDSDGNPDPHRLNFIFKCGVSERDYIGKFDVSNAVKLTEFECEYHNFIFEKTENGSKRKKLVKTVHVDVSLNMEGERKIDGIQND